MNIVVITADYPPIEGGIASVAYQTSLELVALGHDVTVIAPRLPGMDDFDAAQPLRTIRFHGYGLGWFRVFPMLLASWRRARSADLILGINVSHGGVIGWIARCPYVTFAYAYEFLRFKRSPLFAGLLRRIYARSRLVVAISQFTKDALLDFGVAADTVAIIHPGAPEALAIDDERLRAVRQKYALGDKRIVLAVGRFIRRKGHTVLVHALPRILEAEPDVVLVLVGRGPLMSAVGRVAMTLGVRKNIRLPGFVPDEDLAALYSACELFALPVGEDAKGQVEGFGLVFSEAHAYGKPVVAGRSGGVVDAVLDGETGFVVPPRDVEALANAIIEILRDSKKAARMGEAGRARVQSELNWKEFTRRLMDAVDERA
jgi:phosphatidylinositol alpha-1,6-mannosyltransferase